jgi:hypothetical protein
MQRYLEGIPVSAAAHRSEAIGHALGIAVLATLADLGASSDGIPGHLCPFDVRACGHGKTKV